jgi:protein O-GlcNAc transferase
LLKTKQLSEPSVCDKTLQRFAAHGIAPERLLLSKTIVSRDEHLAAYNKVDIALDTFPYPGVTTSAEALWMGVPVLSLQGDRFLSGTAGSIAHNAGLPDWIAADADDYVARAVAFASDLESLAGLRAGLRQQVLASPLFDAPRFARNFEDALWGMWQARSDGDSSPSPEHLTTLPETDSPA